MNRLFFGIFVLTHCILAHPTSANIRFALAQGLLTVKITDLESNEGKVAVAIYKEEEADSFPTDPKKAIKKAFVPIQNKTAVLKSVELPYGTYAVATYHDEDDDQELDMFLVIPSEPIAASNQAKGTMGPPSFEDAKFELKKRKMEITIKMNQ